MKKRQPPRTLFELAGMSKKAMKSQKKKPMKSTKRIKRPTRKLVNFKALPREIKVLHENAKRYAGGNVSLWILTAGLKYKPKGKDLS